MSLDNVASSSSRLDVFDDLLLSFGLLLNEEEEDAEPESIIRED